MPRLALAPKAILAVVEVAATTHQEEMAALELLS
jgi:hypothetical protein